VLSIFANAGKAVMEWVEVFLATAGDLKGSRLYFAEVTANYESAVHLLASYLHGHWKLHGDADHRIAPPDQVAPDSANRVNHGQPAEPRRNHRVFPGAGRMTIMPLLWRGFSGKEAIRLSGMLDVLALISADLVPLAIGLGEMTMPAVAPLGIGATLVRTVVAALVSFLASPGVQFHPVIAAH
jgi:hypothetical protein